MKFLEIGTFGVELRRNLYPKVCNPNPWFRSLMTWWCLLDEMDDVAVSLRRNRAGRLDCGNTKCGNRRNLVPYVSPVPQKFCGTSNKSWFWRNFITLGYPILTIWCAPRYFAMYLQRPIELGYEPNTMMWSSDIGPIISCSVPFVESRDLSELFQIYVYQ